MIWYHSAIGIYQGWHNNCICDSIWQYRVFKKRSRFVCENKNKFLDFFKENTVMYQFNPCSFNLLADILPYLFKRGVYFVINKKIYGFEEFILYTKHLTIFISMYKLCCGEKGMKCNTPDANLLQRLTVNTSPKI